MEGTNPCHLTPLPTYLPIPQPANSTTNKGEPRVQDTGSSPYGTRIGPGQSSAYDTENSRCNRKSVYSIVGYRSPNLPGNPPICKGCRIYASIQISGVGTGNRNRSKIQYRVLLRKRDGTVAEFTPYGVEKITGDAVSMSVEKAKGMFPSAARSLESPEGPIHMLIGVDHMKDDPREQARREGIVL
jgi:hypothetical protein